MRIIVATDSYKGSVSAIGVVEAIKKGILKVFPQAEVIKMPIADGGEGTVESLVSATNGTIHTKIVTGPLGTAVSAKWGILGDNTTGVIEMASSSGLPLVPLDKRNPCITTTFGTGELVKEALDKGLKRLIIGIGGSATNDGGMGFAQALGIHFLDKFENELQPGGSSLLNLVNIDLSNCDPRINALEIIVACDVNNPLCGSKGATAVFGLQKGATKKMISLLDKALFHYGTIATKITNRKIMQTPGSGAAGGLGAGLLFFTNAKLLPGIDIILDATNFSKKMIGADLVITGEGQTDQQTMFGKAPVGVAKIAKKYGVPVICLSGGLSKGYESVYDMGIDAVFSCPYGPMSIEECVEQGEALITHATVRLCKLLAVGKSLRGL